MSSATTPRSVGHGLLRQQRPRQRQQRGRPHQRPPRRRRPHRQEQHRRWLLRRRPRRRRPCLRRPRHRQQLSRRPREHSRANNGRGDNGGPHGRLLHGPLAQRVHNRCRADGRGMYWQARSLDLLSVSAAAGPRHVLAGAILGSIVGQRCGCWLGGMCRRNRMRPRPLGQRFCVPDLRHVRVAGCLY